MTEETNGAIRVLHVDDEPDLVELTATYLERESAAFVVTGETSAAAAIERIEAEPFDCVVSDYEMPGASGLEFLSAVRERRPEVPFILFTARGSEDVASAAISAGVTDYMQKGTDASQYEVLAKRIENAVETYRTRMRHDRQLRAIETAREGIALLDADGCFTFVNEAYAALYGYPPEELVGEHWELLYPEDEIDRVRTQLDPAIERDGQWRGETLGLRADGETFVEDHSLAITEDGGFVCIVREVEVGEPTPLSDWDPGAILKAVPDMVHVVDDEGVIQYANPAASLVTGYDRDELVGASVHRLMEDEDFEATCTFLADLREAWPETKSSEFSWTLQAADGDSFLCDSNASPLFVDGEWRGSIGVVRDVSDRTEREEVLETRNREIELQNGQLETLASVVSHDLRNPLNVATGRLQLAMEDCESDHLDDLDGALERINEIIEDMLTLVREWPSVEEVTSIELEPFVSECWENVATGGATLSVDDSLVIRADERRLRNMLENLLRNAVEHGGDSVTVRVGGLEDGFYVEDDGAGIPKGNREEVFDAGFSTQEAGTGLGLHIVEAIARAHGWEIATAESESGGARFEVTGVESHTD